MSRGPFPAHLRRKPDPTGVRLVRLADVPPRERVRAFERLVARGELSEEEAWALLPTVLDPGDRSFRVAA